MSNYLEHVKKYVDAPNETAVDALVGHLKIALDSRDPQVVAATDPKELASIRSGYCKTVLDLSDDEADQAIETVCETMKGDRHKCRVTFYYLLAQASGKMDRLV